jgi:hypothetical protein
VAGGHAEEPPPHPSFWRVQHGDVAPAARGPDPEGRPVVHRRAVDLLGRLEANGTIDAPMRDAGRIFHAQFRAAALDPLRPAPLVRLPAGTGETLTERRLDARRKAMAALDALGGLDSAAGSCLWHIVGCGCSIREWAARRGWSGRPVGHAQAQGMLIAALGVLAVHFRLRASSGAAQDRPA